MRKGENDSSDKLKLWMNAGDKMKAPEGFSSKVMSHIYIEAKPVPKAERSRMPVVYASLFLLLGIAAMLFVPESNFIVKQITIPWDFNIPFPDFAPAADFTLPNIIIYLISGCVGILLVDSALSAVFKRKI